MYLTTLSISPKGQIVLPKKVRDLFNTNTIALSVNEFNQLVISPVESIAGSLASFQRDTHLSFEEIREQSWLDNSLREDITDGRDR